MKFPSNNMAQGGFAIIQVMIALLLTTAFAVMASGKWSQSVNEAAAESTGRYLVSVRQATMTALTTYQAALTLIDTTSAPTGTYPTAPAWATFSGATTTINVNDLKTSSLLASSFPDGPPLGRSVQVTLVRSGTCPGDTCNIVAYAYTCWPISKTLPPAAVDNKTCPAASSNLQFDANLLGTVLQATDGYGATNNLQPETMHGALFSIPSATLGIPANSPGHIAVIASLTDGINPLYVRQGDTRHIYLEDQLSVSKQLNTDTGLVINTSVVPGAACTTPNMYATASNGAMIQCLAGSWVQLQGWILKNVFAASNGTVITPTVCPGTGMTAFAFATLRGLDVTMTGSDISINGTLGGNVTGSGYVNAAGSVSVSGTFNGTTTSTAASSIRVAQTATIVSNTVSITPASANASAMVYQGCRYL